MPEAHRRTIEKSAPALLSDLDPDDVVPYLVADEALTRDDVDKIGSRATRKEKVQTLLDIIPRRGAGAYVSLLSSLTKTEGSTHLYSTMKTHEEELRAMQHPSDEPSLLPGQGLKFSNGFCLQSFMNFKSPVNRFVWNHPYFKKIEKCNIFGMPPKMLP